MDAFYPSVAWRANARRIHRIKKKYHTFSKRLGKLNVFLDNRMESMLQTSTIMSWLGHVVPILIQVKIIRFPLTKKVEPRIVNRRKVEPRMVDQSNNSTAHQPQSLTYPSVKRFVPNLYQTESEYPKKPLASQEHPNAQISVQIYKH